MSGSATHILFAGAGGAAIALAALALLSFGTHLIYVRYVRRRFPAHGVRVAFGNGWLRVVERGAGPAVVLVHGMNGSAHDFPDALIEDLARDHRVLALDRPGHAGSSRGDGALDLSANARAVLAVMDAFGIDHAVLVGHSYGAAISLRAALDAPRRVSGVLLLAPCTVVDERNRAHTRLPLPPGILRRAALWLFTLPVGIPSAVRTRREAWYPASPPSGPFFSRAHGLVPSQVNAAFENFHTLPRDLEQLAQDLPGLAMPLRVLAGSEDLVTPWRLHAAWIPNTVHGARLDVLEHTGHWLPRQEPGLVAAAVRSLNGAGA
jgi:pimeloyl-ACP methyl ester carboxylesterase